MIRVWKGVEAQIFWNEEDTKVIMLIAVNTFNYYHCCCCYCCCCCSTHCQPLYVKGNSFSAFYASIKAMSLSNVRRMFVAFNYQLKTERSYHKILKLHPFVPSLSPFHFIILCPICSICCCSIFWMPCCAILRSFALSLSYHSLSPSLSSSVYILDCFDNKLENKLILSFNAWNPTGNLIGFILVEKEKNNNDELKYVLWKTGKICTNFGGYKQPHFAAFHPLQNEMREIGHKRKKRWLNMK